MTREAAGVLSLAGVPGVDGPDDRVALIVGHPGHELRVHAWLGLARPVVSVLTDGSGHGGVARTASTLRVIREAGATSGAVFGRFTDRQAYELLREGRLEDLRSLVEEVYAEVENSGCRTVVCDAAEGFNPTHDLCFLVVRSLARLWFRRRGEELTTYVFCLEAPPGEAPPGVDGPVASLMLDDGQLEAKMRAANEYGELVEEVQRALAAHGRQRFAREVFHRTPREFDWRRAIGPRPAYEAHGEQRVAEGIYAAPLRFEAHFLPLVEAFGELGERGDGHCEFS